MSADTPLPNSVIDALGDAQRIGMLGPGSLRAMIDHARAFVAALPDGPLSVVDLGAGGGLPGFVVAGCRDDVHLTMVDRRAKRTDFCRRMVSRLGWSDRVEVVTADVSQLVRESAWQGRFDAAICRGFGPPTTTLSWAAALVRPGGRVIISEPPSDQPDRWPPEVLVSVGVRRRGGPGPVVVFERLVP